MDCSKCNNKNKSGSKFCRSCGVKLSRPNTKLTITLPSFSLPNLDELLSVIRRQNKKAIFVATIVILFGTGIVFAAPKVSDFVKVSGLIKEALRQESDGQYQDALDTLVLTDNRWTTESKRQEIIRLKESQSEYIQFKTSFDSSLEKEKNGELVEAREQLQSIGTEYPQYESVQERLKALQVSIEGNLKETAHLKEVEAQKANAAAAESRQQAAEDSVARTRAEAEKAASDAQARAAAESARDAEVSRQQAEAQARDAEARRQQEEAEKIRQIQISFLNQLLTIYRSFNGDGIDYYNSAMSYYNSDNALTALAIFGQARAIFQNAYNQATSLNSNFSGMPSNYVQAGNDMKNAAYYVLKATDEMISIIGTYSSNDVSYYANLGHSYGSKVRSFLTSQGY